MKVDQQAEGKAGGAQVVEALRHVFVGEALDAFDFDHKHVFDDEVGEVFPDRGALIGY